MKNNFTNKHLTLCWGCEKAGGKCSWSKKFEPVEGWVAIPTKVLVGRGSKATGRKRIYIDSYDVYSCPEYEVLR